MVEQMKTKILKNIDFDAVASLNVQEMNLLVGGEGERYSKEDSIIAIVRRFLKSSSVGVSMSILTATVGVQTALLPKGDL